MGLFAEWVMIKAVSTIEGAEQRHLREAIEQRYAAEGLRTLAELDGWIFARTQGHDPDELIRRLSGRLLHLPVLAGWVYDSDFAYLAGAGPAGSRSRSSFSLVIGTPYTDSAADESSRARDALASALGRRQSASDLAAWSRENAPSPIAAEEALSLLERESTFAEDGLASLFRRLGLPDLEQAVFAPSGPEPTTDQHGVVIPLPIYDLVTLAALDLGRRLDRFSRSQSVGHAPHMVEVVLHDVQTAPADLDELLAEVQSWVDDVGLDYVTVVVAGEPHTVERRAPRPA
jgi:hypothetical protein